ncbi:hypothetical protein ILUMI_23147 [Ignelater luminosus]|uniref:Uncharacterized protein n=1 Tax=Ignelater luminosus TaxID=2038154 RepID=A0A8K0CBE6_IGNLU|nr:hypothetical protein ILUMI_23147 [Ignelater luminosus]
MNLLLKFTDLGRSPSDDENSDFLKSIIEYKENVNNPEMMSNEVIADIFNDFQRLFGIHEKLRDTYYRINEGFENMLSYTEELQKESGKVKKTKQSNQKKKIADDIKKAEQLSTKRKEDIEKIRNILNHGDFQKEKSKIKDSTIVTEIKSPIMERTKEPPSRNSSSRSEKILFCDFCHEYHKVKKDCDYIMAIESIDFGEFEEKQISLEDVSKFEQGDKKYIRSTSDPKQKSSQNAKQIAIQTVKPITRNRQKQTPHTSKPPVTTGKQQCQGCGKYFETNYGQQIWKENELVFWCKDCNIKQLQTELKDTVHSCTEKIVGLRDYIKNLENEYTKCTTNTVSKEEYERLAAAQHNLTMLFYHAQEQNKRLRMQCAETAARLEELVTQYQPQTTSVTQFSDQVKKDNEKPIDSPSTINELLREIQSFRHKDLMIQADIIEKAEEELLRKIKARKSESNLTSSRRRDRCEACRIIQSRSKTVLTKTNKSRQSSSSLSLKSTENKLSSSTSQQSAQRDWIKYDTEESKESTTLLTGMCVHDVREKIDEVHEKIQHYLEERDELVRTYHYTCENPVVSYMTKTINKLFKEWNELKDELNKYSQ